MSQTPITLAPAHTVLPGRMEAARLRVHRRELFAIKLHRWHVLLAATPTPASADSSSSPPPAPTDSRP